MAAVQLYVYDLSRGLARSMSQQIIGRMIEGIWSVLTSDALISGSDVTQGILPLYFTERRPGMGLEFITRHQEGPHSVNR